MKIFLKNDRVRVTFEQTECSEIRFTISGIGSSIPFVDCNYSSFSCFSLSKPWSLEKSVFRKISCRETCGTVIVEAESQHFFIRDIFSFELGMLKINRSWKALSDLTSIVLGTRFCAGNGRKEKITFPGILYNDNPAADPERLVPHLPKQDDGALVVEEHRLPIPGINVECSEYDSFSALTLFQIPSQTPAGELWSMGVQRSNGGRFDLLSLSGAVSFDDKRDHLYGSQCKLFHIPEFGYLDLKSGEVITKTLYIHAADGLTEGRGFCALVEQGMELFSPQENPVLSNDEIIGLKLNALDNRWRETPEGSGFTWILDGRENGNVYDCRGGFLYGWVGQSLRLCWCALKLGISGDQKWMKRGFSILDHFASAPEAGGIAGLKYLYYDPLDKDWFNSEAHSKNCLWSRMTGESLANLAKCLLLLKQHDYFVEDRWETALRRGTDFLLDPAHQIREGIYPRAFDPDGLPMDQEINGAGTACVEALLLAAEYFDDITLEQAALQMLERYNRLFLQTLEIPFSRATLDASCEDKESGIYFFLAAYQAYCRTGEERYAEYARTSALWITTFVYLWSVPWKEDSICAKQGFDSIFWPGVSVQNMHLDVYFPAWEVFDFGRRTGDPMLCRIGHGVMSAWSHGICRYPGDWNFPIPGEQGEQFFHTNFYQGKFDEKAWRGGANTWNPIWIIALVLSAALKFKSELPQH